MNTMNNQKMHRVVEADTGKPAAGTFIILRIDNNRPARRAAEMYAAMVEEYSQEEAYTVRHILTGQAAVEPDLPMWLTDRRGRFEGGGMA